MIGVRTPPLLVFWFNGKVEAASYAPFIEGIRKGLSPALSDDPLDYCLPSLS